MDVEEGKKRREAGVDFDPWGSGVRAARGAGVGGWRGLVVGREEEWMLKKERREFFEDKCRLEIQVDVLKRKADFFEERWAGVGNFMCD